MGFPGVGSSSRKAPGRKQPWWLLARPVETSDLLSGPQELLLPREEEGDREDGKAWGRAIGKKGAFWKKIGCQGTMMIGRSPTELLALRGSMGLSAFCLFPLSGR